MPQSKQLNLGFYFGIAISGQLCPRNCSITHPSCCSTTYPKHYAKEHPIWLERLLLFIVYSSSLVTLFDLHNSTINLFGKGPFGDWQLLKKIKLLTNTTVCLALFLTEQQWLDILHRILTLYILLIAVVGIKYMINPWIRVYQFSKSLVWSIRAYIWD